MNEGRPGGRSEAMYRMGGLDAGHIERRGGWKTDLAPQQAV